MRAIIQRPLSLHIFPLLPRKYQWGTLIPVLAQEEYGWVVNPLHTIQVPSSPSLHQVYLLFFPPQQFRILKNLSTYVIWKRPVAGEGERGLGPLCKGGRHSLSPLCLLGGWDLRGSWGCWLIGWVSIREKALHSPASLSPGLSVFLPGLMCVGRVGGIGCPSPASRVPSVLGLFL